MDSLWRRRFNADPAVIGSQIWLNASPYTVIGVMPSSFKFESKMAGGSAQIWVPVQHKAPASLMHTYEDHEFIALGRLAPGYRADMVAIAPADILVLGTWVAGSWMETTELDGPRL